MEENDITPEKKALTEQKTAQTTKGVVIIVVIALLIIAAITFLFTLNTHNNLKQNNEVQDTINNINTEFNNLKNSQTETISNNNIAIGNLVKEQQNLEREINNLKQKFDNFKTSSTFNNSSWQLLQAKNYMEILNMHSYWGGDANTMISLLKNIDNILVNFSGNDVFALRQNIERTTNTLREYSLDKVGILTKIDSIIDEVATLSLKSNVYKDNALSPTSSNNVDATNNQYKNNFNKALDESLKVLSKLVVIRKTDSEDQFVSLQNETLIRNRLIMTLKEVQWSVLNNNLSIFLRSLNQAINDINKNFDVNLPKTKTILDQLNEFKNIKFSPANMDFSEDIKLLNTLIEKQTMQKPIDEEQS